jgi:hypothetical protein
VHGWAPDDLLDSYDRERQAPARKVLANTRAQIALMNPDPYVTPLRELFTDLMRKEQVNRHLAEMLSGVTVRYAIDGPEHRLLGDFARDLELKTEDGVRPLPKYLKRGTGLLLDLTGDGQIGQVHEKWAAGASWAGRLQHVRAECAEEPQLAGLLVRPDGYVAWAADRDMPEAELRESLTAAVTTWFGTD